MNEAKNFKMKLIMILSLIFAVFLFAVLSFAPDLYRRAALAVTGNYSKTTGEQLTVGDWNNLDNDFLDKQNPAGDAMAGPLTLPGVPAQPNHAATKGYVDAAAGGSDITEILSGATMRAVCGQTAPGATNWQSYSSDTLFVDVVMPVGAFTSAPYYFTSLGGTNSHYATVGGSSIYPMLDISGNLLPLEQGFRVYVKLLINVINPSVANSYGWHINWCAYSL